MSRSTKEPYVTQQSSKNWDSKFAKRLANKRVRRQEVADDGAFKKASESYDINDFTFPDSSPKGRRK